MTERLVIFDFDLTLLKNDSDEVLDILAKGRHLPYSYDGSWLNHINGQLQHLQLKYKVKQDEMVKALGTLRFCDGHVEMLRKLGSLPDTKLMVMSDSNKFFIETALESKGLLHLFTKIISNDANIDSKGHIDLRPNSAVAKRAQSGTCPTRGCSSNLCKGSEIQNLLKEYNNPQIWYVGDGANDWCAAVALPSDEHHVFARKSYPLHGYIKRNMNGKALKCNPWSWNDGHELLACMARLDSRLKN